MTNDAVNFLNSAVGARVATRRRILMVASIGVIFGALVSSGMMEVARKGVFDPGLFVAADGTIRLEAILAVYLGVMAADVIMLDLFNTFGLPTSTTVSIVSELVGASIAVNLWANTGGIREAIQIVEGGPVLGIYTGILLSVLIAFSVSALAMFLLRWLFTHDLAATFPRYGWFWTALSFCSIGYFVLYKGLRKANFVSPEVQDVIYGHIWWIMAGLAVASIVFSLIYARRHQVVFKAIIMTGTCALAIAFAGNDLVNFIGPSVAAFQATFVQGVDLTGSVPTPAWGLLLAGVIMVGALWSSKKAKTVTDTEVRLAAAGVTEQRFKPTPFARFVVRSSTAFLKGASLLAPASLRRSAARRVQPPAEQAGRPPYDLLRASVNLTIASILISIGTMNKLPLSTTYITFMAAMGAAMGDGTWDRASADSRVSGMFAVLTGWLATGVIAASGAFVMASVVYLVGQAGEYGPLIAIAVVIGIVAVSLVKLAATHSKSLGTRKTVVDEV